MNLKDIDNIGDLIMASIALGKGRIEDKFGYLLDAFNDLFITLLYISILLYSIAILFRNMHLFKEIAVMFVWVSVTTSIVKSGFYYDFFQLLMATRIKISIFLATGEGHTIFSAIQDSFSALYGLGAALIDSGSMMTNVMPIVIGCTVNLICAIYYVSLVANLLLCELLLYILYFLGTFILLISCFKSARPMLQSWIKAIAKYSLVFVISGIVISLIDAAMRPILHEVIFQSYQDGGYSASGIPMKWLGAVLVLGCFGAVLMVKAMEISSELTGGVMSDGNAGVQSIKNAFNTTRNTLRGR